ncbi:hypothetical protein BDE02_14G109800 [Populus trichocarpa]|nr:hypothetical protein BDE02_14G109800 [Populus trichocarpa]
MAKLEPKQRTEMVEDKEKKAQVCRFCSSGADLRGGLFFKRLQICQGKFWSTEPGVRTVEDTVRTVIGPVYDKFHDVPFQLLKFVDHKIDESLRELDRQVPSQIHKLEL